MYKLFTIITFFLFISCEQHLNNSDTAIDIKENKPAEDVYNYPETVLGIRLGTPYDEHSFMNDNKDILFYDVIDNQPCYILLNQNMSGYKWVRGTHHTEITQILGFPAISTAPNINGQNMVNGVMISLANSLLNTKHIEIDGGSTKSNRVRRLFDEDVSALIDSFTNTYGSPVDMRQTNDSTNLYMWQSKNMIIQVFTTIDTSKTIEMDYNTKVWEVNLYYKYTFEKNQEVFGTQKLVKPKLI